MSDLKAELANEQDKGIHSIHNACMFRDECRANAKRIAELEAQVKALKTHPCLLEDGQFDHDWKFVDDSFDHEFGTERVHYFKCRHCEAHRDADEGDCTIDEGGH